GATRRSHTYAENPTNDPNTIRYPSPSQDAALTCARWTCPASPVTTPATPSSTPPISISIPVPTRGRDGRGARLEYSEPAAHENEANTTAATPAVVTWTACDCP